MNIMASYWHWNLLCLLCAVFVAWLVPTRAVMDYCSEGSLNCTVENATKIMTLNAGIPDLPDFPCFKNYTANLTCCEQETTTEAPTTTVEETTTESATTESSTTESTTPTSTENTTTTKPKPPQEKPPLSTVLIMVIILSSVTGTVVIAGITKVVVKKFKPTIKVGPEQDVPLTTAIAPAENGHC